MKSAYEKWDNIKKASADIEKFRPFHAAGFSVNAKSWGGETRQEFRLNRESSKVLATSATAPTLILSLAKALGGTHDVAASNATVQIPGILT